MKNVVIAKNPFDLGECKTFQVESVCELLETEFETFPNGARIYNAYVAEANDVTPVDQASYDKLEDLEGPIVVVCYPEEPISATVMFFIAVGVFAVSAAAFLLLMPQAPKAGKNEQESPNNGLSERQNRARPLSRIPDIYGEVVSTPDLIAVPYKIYDNNKELEIAFMCVGRGEYEVSKIRDDTTLISEIDGASVEVYGPGTSPLSGSPTTTVGAAITNDPYNVVRITGVNGQVILPSNGGATLAGNWRFISPNQLENDATEVVLVEAPIGEFTEYDYPIELSNYFANGDVITITMSDYVDGIYTVNLTGTYTISAISGRIGSVTAKITLDTPEATNADWTTLASLTGSQTAYVVATVSSTIDGSVGPFFINMPTLTKVYCNFVALQGLYKLASENRQRYYEVVVMVTISPCDEDGVVNGSPEYFSGTVVGSASEKSLRALTLVCEPTFTGRCKVSAERVTALYTGDAQIVEEIKWADLYGIAPFSVTEWGDVTTVLAQTYATEGALSVKNRKLNMLVTRKVPVRVSGSTFGALTATKQADAIISAICLDNYIGNRDVTEVDFDSIYDTVAEIIAYFGIDEAAEFCYTFDNSNLTFEETIAIIAESIFCIAYRSGNVIKLFFEQLTSNSSMLFNHRNKVPRSEVRSFRFGLPDNIDGIEYTYVDSTDEATVTYYIPTDQSAINPRKIESVGVRNAQQAYLHAWRRWNKIQYQNTAVEFIATQEADLLIQSERFLLTDDTRSDTQAGEVLSQSVLTLELSQPCDLSGGGFVIYLQLPDGTVESKSITAGVDAYHVVLSGATSVALAIGPELFAPCVYTIVGPSQTRPLAFLLTERNPQGDFTSQVRAINYDARYYAEDLAYDTNRLDFTLADNSGLSVLIGP